MRLNDFLAKRIRALRQQNNFSQNELAEMVRRQWGLKWTQVTVAAIESGREVLLGMVKQAFEAGTGMVSGEVKDVVNRRLRVA